MYVNIDFLELRYDAYVYPGTNQAPVLCLLREYGAIDDYVTGLTYASEADWNARRAGVPIA